ncbi:hypothetical protein [Halodurantibacterium flavum]|uniref:Lipoprotein n=1 Tax=Halodurantibacterium flavum TaxID=1382802 RepID=A0ABW4S7B0_9RHOB
MRGLFLISLLALAGCWQATQPPVPQYTGTPRERLVQAVEASGCAINPANSARIQQSTGLTEAQIRALVLEEAQAGMVEITGPDTVKIITENCR